MRVGVQLPEVEYEAHWPELADMVRAVEDLGFDSVWVGDHLLYRQAGSVVGPWEAWTQLAAIAAITSRVRLGPLVAALPFHRPAVLAKMASTVDEISGGRLVVGVGAGWNRDEFDAFGIPYRRRVDRFAESFDIVRRLLAGEEVTVAGEFETLDRCVLKPGPKRPGGPPLMVGSTGPRMLSLTLPHVSAWNAWYDDFGNDPRRLPPLLARVEAACRDTGRDPATLEKTVALHLGLGPAAPRRGGTPPLTGTTGEQAEALAEVAETGVDEVQLVLSPIDRGSIEEAGEVLERFRR